MEETILLIGKVLRRNATSTSDGLSKVEKEIILEYYLNTVSKIEKKNEKAI